MRTARVAALLLCVTSVLVLVIGNTHTLPPMPRVVSGTSMPISTPMPTATALVTASPLPKATPSTAIYVAIGASDAFGIGTDDPATQNWPTVLSTKVVVPLHLINLGIPSATTDLAVRDELPIAVTAQPTIVTIWLGVNDFDDGVSLDDFIAHTRQLLVALHDQTHAAIYVGNLPDLTLLAHFATRNRAQLEAQIIQWNSALSMLCIQQGAIVVDIYSRWDTLRTHPEYLGKDGFHPSTEGAKQLAAIFANAIIASGGVNRGPA